MPEFAENRSTTSYDMLIEVEASGFPYELWHYPGANFVFGHLGKLCCVDRCSLHTGDYTAMCGFVQIEVALRIPPAATIRLPGNELAHVRFRVVQAWTIDDDIRAEIFEPRDPSHTPPPSRCHNVCRSRSAGSRLSASGGLDGILPGGGATPTTDITAPENDVNDIDDAPIQVDVLLRCNENLRVTAESLPEDIA